MPRDHLGGCSLDLLKGEIDQMIRQELLFSRRRASGRNERFEEEQAAPCLTRADINFVAPTGVQELSIKAARHRSRCKSGAGLTAWHWSE